MKRHKSIMQMQLPNATAFAGRNVSEALSNWYCLLPIATAAHAHYHHYKTSCAFGALYPLDRCRLGIGTKSSRHLFFAMLAGETDSSTEVCPCKSLQYYLPAEVVLHNKPNDCWVTYLGGVYDLTDLCGAWKDAPEIKPIIAHAGKDISHWFDHRANDIRHFVNPSTGVSVPYCPHGPIPDVGHSGAATIRRPLDRCPWWLDNKYKKGYLTKNPRPCRIINVLAGTAAVISVCEEDTITRIQERFLIFNAHGASYEWKFEGKRIDMNATLTENGIPDERDRYVACGLPEDIYIPSLMCYFQDDLTEA